MAGQHYVDPRALPIAVSLQAGDGYDGQFYFRLALNPFLQQRTALGITLDNPPYRAQRLLYPLLAWLLSVGNPHMVPLLLIALNYVALCALGWAAARYAQLLDQHAFLGLGLALSPGLLLAMARDTAEILACCLLCWGLLALQRCRPGICGLLCLAAALAKETAILFAATALLCSVVQLARTFPGSVYARKCGWVFTAVLTAFLGWQTLVFAIWRSFAVQSGAYNIGYPFVGMRGFLADVVSFRLHPQRLWFLECILLLLFAAMVLARIRRAPVMPQVKLTFVFYLGLAILLGRAVWVDDWAFLRATAELYLFGMWILIAAAGRLGKVAALGAASLWIYLCCDILTTR